MVKFQLRIILILLGCVVFISCEKASQMLEPVMPDTDSMESMDSMDTSDTGMMDTDKMMDMMDAVLEGSPVVINELMADNDNTVPDPQGDYDDWLELHNRTDMALPLTGLYLSDKEDNPTKWAFPENTVIPANGYLIVWLDEDHDDENATEGLHANFKLSKGGETVMLVDTDARGNQVLDSVTFGEQETDVAYGRLPNGTGDFQVLQATPGVANLGE
ncbi:MAG: lamin tail domain-containing protein [Candidatus Poribacteria bacterium]|nr:lamin tail domain-containing protein [Candidatus Poribacteria bacterium]